MKCEVCLKNFNAKKERPINICPECVEKLRKKGLGPVQLLGHAEIKPRVLSIMRRGL